MTDEVIQQDVIEDHPRNKPAPWISNATLAPKPDGSIRITVDARNINKRYNQQTCQFLGMRILKLNRMDAKYFSRWTSSLRSGRLS